MNEIERARRTTWKVLVSGLVVLWALIAGNVVLGLSLGRLDWWRTVPAMIAALGFTWLSSHIVNAVLDRRHPTGQVVGAAVLALVTAGLGGADAVGHGWALVCWSSVAVLWTPRLRARLIAVGTGLAGVALSAVGHEVSLIAAVFRLTAGELLVVNTLAYGMLCWAQPVSNRVWVWIWALATEAHKGRTARTELALTEERLRFSRDLHDLVGHRLSAIAVKTDLAARLSEVDPAAAKDEMAEVNRLTRTALKELRQAVRGHRELDLTAEVNSVKGVLEAAGVRCETLLPGRDLPDGVAPVFAYVVREAVTNVLKHSSASFCEIIIRFTEQQAELSVRNDGVAHRQAADPGSGLAGMGERLEAVGGRVTAVPAAGGQFLLTAVVSLPLGG